jgi:lipopolysaccharide assembly outer membrane protein LptD (OstA)
VKFIFFLWLLITSFCGLRAQSDSIKIIEIKNADLLIGEQRNGEALQRLIGRVKFEHNGALLFADSAWLWNSKQSLTAFGHIKMEQGDTLQILGDTLHYDGIESKAVLLGRVNMADPQMRLKTNQITYLRNQNRVVYNQTASIKNGKETIESKEGQYDAANQYFTFRNGVQINSSDYSVRSDTLRYDARNDLSTFYGPTYIYTEGSVIYLEYGWYDQNKEVAKFSKNASVFSDGKWLFGDTLYYEQKNGYGWAKGHVVLLDTLENLKVLGNHAETFDKLNRFYTTDSAQLLLFEPGRDTLFLTADTLFGNKTNGQQVLEAHQDVAFFQPTLQGRSSFFKYQKNDSLLYMLGDPVLWTDSTQMTADTIQLKQHGNGHDSLFLNGNSRLIQQADTLFQQLAGHRMQGVFQNNSLQRLWVFENAKSIYYPSDKDGYVGRNELICRTIRMEFLEKKVHTLTCLGNPSGTLFPIKPEPQTRISGFVWWPNDRPLQPIEIFRPRQNFHISSP